MTQTTARSTRQSWRGQPFSLNTILPLIANGFTQLYSDWIEPHYFKNKLHQRLQFYGLSDLTLAPVLTVDCVQQCQCAAPICRKMIISYEDTFSGFYSHSITSKCHSITSKSISRNSVTPKPQHEKRTTLHAIDLKYYKNYDDYKKEMAKKSGNFLRDAKKANRAGYRVQLIEPSNHSPDIVSIHRSLKIRSFGLMFDSFFINIDHLGGLPKQYCTVPEPACQEHWEFSFGVLAERPGYKQGAIQTNQQLLGYARLHRIGNTLFYRDFIGHGEYVADGIMKLLHIEMMQWILDRNNPFTQDVHQLIYGALERGSEGLFNWKKRSLFAPYLIDLVLQSLPEDFDAQDYLRLNPDIDTKQMSPEMHYKLHGQSEKRHYKIQVPHDFDAANYLRLNSDIPCELQDAELHYTKHGSAENRRY